MWIFFAAAAGSLKSSAVLDMLYPRAYDARRILARDAALARSSVSENGIPLAGDSMTYGEFDLDFLGSLLEAAEPQKGDTFVDCGSGCGRLVLGAALLRPKVWAECHGIELLPELHNEAVAARMRMDELPELSATMIAPVGFTALSRPGPVVWPASAARAAYWPRLAEAWGSLRHDLALKAASEEQAGRSVSHLTIDPGFTCADLWSDEAAAPLAAASVAFAYAVTWARDDEEGCLTELSALLARRLSDGARVVSIDLKLRSDAHAAFEPVAEVAGWNAETGDSTGRVYRVRKAGSLGLAGF